jgi:hypothetical protein
MKNTIDKELVQELNTKLLETFKDKPFLESIVAMSNVMGTMLELVPGEENKATFKKFIETSIDVSLNLGEWG